MRGTGHTHQEIADEIGVSRSTVANHLKQLKNEAEEHGVDETLQRILSVSGINGLIAKRIMDDLEWWMNHHRISSHWLIIRLWQLCYPGDEDIETLKTVVKAALPKYATDTGIDLAKWALEQNRCVNCGSTLAPSRQRSGDCCRIVVMK
jgi:predicted transcriptional regulator